MPSIVGFQHFACFWVSKNSPKWLILHPDSAILRPKMVKKPLFRNFVPQNRKITIFRRRPKLKRTLRAFQITIDQPLTPRLGRDTAWPRWPGPTSARSGSKNRIFFEKNFSPKNVQKPSPDPQELFLGQNNTPSPLWSPRKAPGMAKMP